MTARGIVRRGSLRLLAERRRRLEADERQQAEDHPLEGRSHAIVAGQEHAQRVLVRVHDEQRRDQQEDHDLDDAEDDARPRRDPDAPIDEPPDDEPAQDRQPEPGVFEVDAEVGRQEDRAVEAEPSEEERHHQGLGQREAPRDEPAEERSEPVADVGEHPSGGWQVLRELGHGVRREQHGDHREEHGQRRDPAGERRGRADRQCRRHSGRHVGDRLEQHLGQARWRRAPATGPLPPLVARTRSSRPSSLPPRQGSPSSLCWGQAAAEY